MTVQMPPRQFIQTWLPVYEWLVPRLNDLVVGGGNPTSWWRSAQENARVGGDSESQHLFGFAADFHIRSGALLSLRDRARRMGLIAVAETDHLHVQIFPAGTLRAAGLFDVRSA